MTTTRTPTGQDLVCLVCRTDKDIDIDHVQNRGMGGSKERDVPENKVPLCRECHTAKTSGVLETRLRSVGTLGLDLETGETSYESLWYEWRRKGADASWIPVPVEVSKRYKCLVLSAAAEARGSLKAKYRPGTPEIAGSIPAPDKPSAPSPSVGQEESNGQGHGIPSRDTGGSRIGGAVVDADTSSPLTHDQRAAIAAGIKEMEWGRQWLAGDTAIEWIAELGESAEQYISDFGYQPEPMSNIIRVCEAIKPPFRNANLRFSHHVVVYDLNREDMEMWLDKCVEEGWSVAEFRIQVKGGRPRVKRYSPGEIHALADEYPFEPARDEVRDFADWLGQRDNDGLD